MWVWYSYEYCTSAEQIRRGGQPFIESGMVTRSESTSASAAVAVHAAVAPKLHTVGSSTQATFSSELPPLWEHRAPWSYVTRDCKCDKLNFIQIDDLWTGLLVVSCVVIEDGARCEQNDWWKDTMRSMWWTRRSGRSRRGWSPRGPHSCSRLAAPARPPRSPYCTITHRQYSAVWVWDNSEQRIWTKFKSMCKTRQMRQTRDARGDAQRWRWDHVAGGHRQCDGEGVHVAHCELHEPVHDRLAAPTQALVRPICRHLNNESLTLHAL